MNKKDFSRTRPLNIKLLLNYGQSVMDISFDFEKSKHIKHATLKKIKNNTFGPLMLRYGRGGSSDFLSVVINDFSKTMLLLESLNMRTFLKKGYLKNE